MKKIICLAGLPRSGGTWLSTILQQNSNIYVTPTSPVVEILWQQYNMWKSTSEFFSDDKIQKIKRPYLSKSIQIFYEELTDRPVVIDNEIFWQTTTNIEMYLDIFGELPKIICPIRNIEEIEASGTLLFENNNKNWKTSKMREVFRVAYDSFLTTYNSQYKDCLFLVDYKNLVTDTQKVINSIYNFIGEQTYQHNFDEIIFDKRAYSDVEKLVGLNGLHDVKRGIKKSKTNPKKVLTETEYLEFQNLNFWKQSETRIGR